MTTKLENAEKFAVLIGVPVALLATGISYWQLKSSISSIEKQMQQEKSSLSMQVAASYLNSQDLIEAKKIINLKTKNGTDYSQVSSNGELYNSVQAILNHLETTATGVQAGVYKNDIICKSLKNVVAKQVEVHIKGQRPAGVVKSNPQPFAQSDFPSLIAVYDQWSKQTQCLS